MAVEDCDCIAGVPPSEKLAGLYCVFKAISEGITPSEDSVYLQPNGVDGYLQPGGAFTYLRP